jgi:hypothetical protein
MMRNTQNSNRWKVVRIAIFAVAAIMVLYIGINWITAKISAFPQGTPASIEVVVQDSPDNYGVAPYFILRDVNGRQITAFGEVHLTLMTNAYPVNGYQTVYDRTFPITPGNFISGARGNGSERVIVCTFGKIPTEYVSRMSGKAYITFTLNDGTMIKAKDSVWFP